MGTAIAATMKGNFQGVTSQALQAQPPSAGPQLPLTSATEVTRRCMFAIRTIDTSPLP
jgi:hypothetical protein